MNFKYLLVLLVSLMIFGSCGFNPSILASGPLSDQSTYKMFGYSGCCGCRAKYYNIYRNKLLVEQIVYKYNCYSVGLPTKFKFIYDQLGKLSFVEKYAATMSDHYEFPLTVNERELFAIANEDSVQHDGR